MADERTWELEYCTDKWYQVPTEEDRAKLQVLVLSSQNTSFLPVFGCGLCHCLAPVQFDSGFDFGLCTRLLSK